MDCFELLRGEIKPFANSIASGHVERGTVGKTNPNFPNPINARHILLGEADLIWDDRRAASRPNSHNLGTPRYRPLHAAAEQPPGSARQGATPAEARTEGAARAWADR